MAGTRAEAKTKAQRWICVAGLASGLILVLVFVTIVVALVLSRKSRTSSTTTTQGGASDGLPNLPDSPTILPSETPVTAAPITPAPSQSVVPSDLPTVTPTLNPSESTVPSFEPSDTVAPSHELTNFPSPVPSTAPSNSPAIATLNPTFFPTLRPSSALSAAPSALKLLPSSLPSSYPSSKLEVTTPKLEVTTFYAIGDVPYSDEQEEELKQQLLELPGDAEFVIHVGDIRSEDSKKCRRSEYEKAAELLRTSHAPVFVIIGDNDWTDCSNRDEGLEYWQDEFIRFESRYWNHTFDIRRQPGRPANFAFEHKGTLFMGFNIVGGDIHSHSEWSRRLTEQVEWTIELIRDYQTRQPFARVGRVVIFGHANPKSNHKKYFYPLRSFIQDELENQLPILYINGDKHEWLYETSFYLQESFLRIMVTGKTVDPPLKVMVHANGDYLDTHNAFVIDRRL